MSGEGYYEMTLIAPDGERVAYKVAREMLEDGPVIASYIVNRMLSRLDAQSQLKEDQ